MSNAPKPTTAKKETSGGSSIFAVLAIVICIAIAWAIYLFVMGNPANFEGGDNNNHPLQGNYLGMIYKGGVVVAFLIGMLLMVVVFSIERYFVINKAAGKGNVDAFVKKVQQFLSTGNIDNA